MFGSSEDWAQLWEAEYGRTPTYQAAAGSASVLVLMRALSRANNVSSAESLADVLRTTNETSFYGELAWTQNGAIIKETQCAQLSGGRPVIVAPSEFKSGVFAKFRLVARTFLPWLLRSALTLPPALPFPRYLFLFPFPAPPLHVASSIANLRFAPEPVRPKDVADVVHPDDPVAIVMMAVAGLCIVVLLVPTFVVYAISFKRPVVRQTGLVWNTLFGFGLLTSYAVVFAAAGPPSVGRCRWAWVCWMGGVCG